MCRIIVLCGVSHAGKTTYANELNADNQYTYINTDTIRMAINGSRKMVPATEPEVWAKYEQQRTKAVVARDDIILDACHISPQSRWHALKNTDEYKRTIVIFDPSLEELARRCRETNRIDFKIVEDMYNKKNIPSNAELVQEGFQEIIRL